MATPRTFRADLSAGRQRGRIASAWLVIRWPLFATVVGVAGALGYVGFRRYFADQSDPRSVTDLLYLTLQLFVLESGSVPPTAAPWQIEVARILAPATTGLAILVALAAAFREEIAEVRLRFQRRHVVVCGLGSRGSRLAASLLRAGYRVVGVERAPQAGTVAELRRLGGLIIEGDARSSEVLRRARVHTASHIVALTSRDDTNAEIAIRAGAVAPDRGPALTCLAHVRDPGLCAMLRAEELAAAHTTNYRLDFFNLHEQGARALLRDHPPFESTEGEIVLAVVGLTPVGEALVVEAARQWRILPEARDRRLRIAVFDREAKRRVDVLHARYPQLEHVADVRPVDTSVEHADLVALQAEHPPRAVYVCVDDDSAALEIGLRIHRLLRGSQADVVVELTRSAGLAALLERPGGYERLHAFDVLDRTLDPELLLGGTYEILARAVHTEYFDEQLRQGATAASNPSLVPWEQLPESLKESNRDQAAHIGVKLAAIGCGIAPLSDWSADRLTFSEHDVERLAMIEHERWVDQRLRDHWKPGPKDIESKVSPYLVPWSQLSEDVKEWDRRAVRGIPAFLARAGYQVVRVRDLAGSLS